MICDKEVTLQKQIDKTCDRLDNLTPRLATVEGLIVQYSKRMDGH